MKCILCGDSRVKITERVRAADLAALYRRSLAETAHILTQDLDYWHCEACDLRFFALENGAIPCGDDAFYNALNKFEWYYATEKHEYALAREFLRPDDLVLEVGCGKAAFSAFVPDKNRYVGLEFSSDAVKMAKKNGVAVQNIAVEDFAEEHLGKFSVACSFQVLEHTHNPHSFIAAQIACLRGGAADSKDSQDSRNLGGESCGDSRVGGARSGESCVAESRGAATQNAESCLNPAVVSDVAGGGGIRS